MKEIWQKSFQPSYVRPDGVLVLNDKDIPRPEGFSLDSRYRSTIVFPPKSRAGDHVHNVRQELFVGFGADMQLLIEDSQSKEVKVFEMDPSKHGGLCVAFFIEIGTPHAVRNVGPEIGILVELASHPQEKVDYRIVLE